MKRSVAAALVVFALGCGEATEPEIDSNVALVSAPTEVTIRNGEQVRVGDALRITFLRVVEDSRCPIDAVCVWMGNATVEIGMSVGSTASFPIQLNTAVGQQSTEWAGVRITLLEVQPAPRAATPTKAEDYSVKLKLEPVD